MNGLSDLGEPLRPVVDGVHRRRHREQGLGGADVGRRALAANVLLACLQRQAVSRIALSVDGHAYEAARHLALELVGHRHVRGVRAAVEQRHAEALGGADGDVGAELARGLEKREREDVGVDGGEATALVDGLDDRARVEDVALGARVG